jgi:hypothetical protein
MVDDPVIIYPKWQTQLMAALAETNPDKLLERVKEAEKVIFKRFEKISRSTSHAAEIEAIEKGSGHPGCSPNKGRSSKGILAGLLEGELPARSPRWSVPEGL